MEALGRLSRALSEYAVLGVTTNLEFLGALASDPAFVAARYDTEFVDRRSDLRARRVLDVQDRATLLSAVAALSGLEAPMRVSQDGGLSPWVLAERARLR